MVIKERERKGSIAQWIISCMFLGDKKLFGDLLKVFVEYNPAKHCSNLRIEIVVY